MVGAGRVSREKVVMLEMRSCMWLHPRRRGAHPVHRFALTNAAESSSTGQEFRGRFAAGARQVSTVRPLRNFVAGVTTGAIIPCSATRSRPPRLLR